MSLTVTAELKELAREGNLPLDEFINCIRRSLPRAWQVIDELAAELRSQQSLTHAIHAPRQMEDEQRGQLLRLMASSSMRAAVERFYGLRFEFQNCHNTAAFRQNAVGSAEHRRFTSPEAQILAQAPELVDC
jgi:NucS shadow ORF